MQQVRVNKPRASAKAVRGMRSDIKFHDVRSRCITHAPEITLKMLTRRTAVVSVTSVISKCFSMRSIASGQACGRGQKVKGNLSRTIGGGPLARGGNRVLISGRSRLTVNVCGGAKADDIALKCERCFL